MILQNEQEAEAFKAPDKSPDLLLARVATVYGDGISLRLPGEDMPTQKHYSAAQTCIFKSGQRVLVARVSGEYIVLCPVGGPLNVIVADEIRNTGTNYGNIRLCAQYTNQLKYQIKGLDWIIVKNQ